MSIVLSERHCLPPLSRTPARFRPSAFTLIEVVISASLMSLIIVTAYLCFSASVAGRREMEPRLEVIQNARVAMALMTADLRAACPLDRNSEFVGMHRMMGNVVADNLDFATHNYTPQRAGEGDFCEESFYLQPDPETGAFSLWRRRNPLIAPDPLSGGKQEEIATGLRGLRFEYFDGLDWYDTWGDAEGKARTQSSQREQPNLSGMPDAVRITLWFEVNHGKQIETSQDGPMESRLVFQTIARLNLASTGQSGPGGSTGASTSSDPNGQTPGAAGTGGGY